jgi:hypothetical protein
LTREAQRSKRCYTNLSFSPEETAAGALVREYADYHKSTRFRDD